MRKQMKEIKGAKLINKLSSEELVCDIMGEDTIDGKVFWIVAQGARIFKIAKDGYEMKRGR